VATPQHLRCDQRDARFGAAGSSSPQVKAVAEAS
jgi:hypothetical protein